MSGLLGVWQDLEAIEGPDLAGLARMLGRTREPTPATVTMGAPPPCSEEIVGSNGQRTADSGQFGRCLSLDNLRTRAVVLSAGAAPSRLEP